MAALSPEMTLKRHAQWLKPTFFLILMARLKPVP
jgi:hypothetical protein